jgi:hypothetical protein
MSRSRERSRSPCVRDSDADERWLSDIFAEDECVDIPPSAIDTEEHLLSGSIASATGILDSAITASIHADVESPVLLTDFPTPQPVVELVEARSWPIIPQLVDSEFHEWGFLLSQEYHRNQCERDQLPYLRAPPGTILWLAIGGHEYRIVAGEIRWVRFC